MSRAARVIALVLVGICASASVWAAPAPMATAQSGDIRDIRGPEPIPNPWRWALLGGGAVLLVGVAIAVAKRRRRGRALTADARALARLDEAQSLALAERPREYAQAASDAVREYIEERFGMASSRATTEEFLQDLVGQTSSPIGGHRPSLEQFLAACDLAKFARYQLPAAGMASLNDLARQFVLATAARPSSASAKERS